MKRFMTILLISVFLINSFPVLSKDWTQENYNIDPLSGGKTVTDFYSWFFGDLSQKRLLELVKGEEFDRKKVNIQVKNKNVRFDVPAPESFLAQAFYSGVCQETINNRVPGQIFGAVIPGDGSFFEIGGKKVQVFIPMYRLLDGKRDQSCFNTSLTIPVLTPTPVPNPPEPNSPPLPAEPNNPPPTVIKEKEVIKVIEKYIYIQDIYSVAISYPQSREVKGGVVYGNSLSGGGFYLYSVPSQEEKEAEKTCTPTVVPTPPNGCTPPVGPVTTVTPPAGVTPVTTAIPVSTPSPQNTWSPPTPPSGI